MSITFKKIDQELHVRVPDDEIFLEALGERKISLPNLRCIRKGKAFVFPASESFDVWCICKKLFGYGPIGQGDTTVDIQLILRRDFISSDTEIRMYGRFILGSKDNKTITYGDGVELAEGRPRVEVSGSEQLLKMNRQDTLYVKDFELGAVAALRSEPNGIWEVRISLWPWRKDQPNKELKGISDVVLVKETARRGLYC